MDVNSPSRQCVGSESCGFTLVEFIAAISISAILLGIVIPAFSNIINDTQLSTQVNEFAGYLNYARSAAIKYGERVQVCKSVDQQQCDNSSSWEDGWIIFVDSNMNRQRNSGEVLLQTATTTADMLSIDYGAFPTDNYVVYYPSGRSLGNGTFTFCDQRGSEHAHALVLYKTGRLRAADIMPDGSPLSCS